MTLRIVAAARVARLSPLIAAVALANSALAVPYASHVRNTSGTTWEFVLNQAADDVTITRDGGSPVALGSLSEGVYTFDMSGFNGFDIQVTNSAPEGMTRVSDPANIYTEFQRPAGLAINKDPASPYFGTIYVANTATGTSSIAPPRNDRVVGDGIYSLRPDLQGIDLSDWSSIDPNDPNEAKRGAGWTTAGNNSPFRIALDNGGNILAGDWSDENGGIKYIGPDLQGGGLVLAFEDGTTWGQGAINSNAGPGESPFIHAQVRGVPNVLAGEIGNGLVVAAMDQSLHRFGETLVANFQNGTYPDTSLPDTDDSGNPNDGQHIWKWNVGSATNAEVSAELVIDVGSQGANPDFELGTDTSGRPYLIGENIPVRGDAEFFPQLGEDGLWILTQPRFDGNESGITIVDVDETGASAPEVVWSSRQWTIDNDLDGYVGTDAGATVPDDPNNDVFRNTGTVDVSNDGSTLYVHRWLTDDPDFQRDGSPSPDVNPYVGSESNLPGALLAVPLDENGVPTIVIDDNGTPGDTSDDILTNLESIETTDQDLEFELNPPIDFPVSIQENHEVEVDAAGNIYITDDISRLLEVFSPGGDSVTTFSFDGVEFSFDDGSSTATPMLLGDADGDGDVDGDDLIAVQTEFGAIGATPLLGDADADGDVDGDDLISVQTNFGETLSAAVAVPEPGAALLAVVAGLGLAARRR